MASEPSLRGRVRQALRQGPIGRAKRTTMSWNQLKAKLAFLFGRRHQFALCSIRARNCGRMLMVVGALLLARSANASVLATGVYSPADNPFTTSVNEGIPTDGNFVNPFELPGTGGVVFQTFFEGRHSDGNNTADPSDDTNINFDIYVGTFVPSTGGGATLAGSGSL